MSIAVSGLTGFVGTNISKYLNDREIFPITREIFNNINFIFDTQIDAVIHLAGKAHDTKNISRSEEYFIVNTELTKRVFDSFLKSNARDFIFFSSIKAVADTTNGVLDERTYANPQTAYGQSKWHAEQYINSKVLSKGKRVFILRPCMIHGPGNKGNLNLLYNIVRRGLPWPLAAFENQRSFLSMQNLQFIMGQILENRTIPGGTYNLADDEALSTNEVVRLIADSNGSKPLMWPISPKVIRAGARVGDILRLPYVNSESLKKLTESYIVDNSKIKAALNVIEFPVSAREGLLTTLKSF